MSKCKPKVGSDAMALLGQSFQVGEEEINGETFVVIKVPLNKLANVPEVQAKFQGLVSLAALEQSQSR